MKVRKLRPLILIAFIIGCFPLHSADHVPLGKLNSAKVQKVLKQKSNTRLPASVLQSKPLKN